MPQPLAFHLASPRHVDAPTPSSTDRLAAALLGGAALGGATLFACAVQGWGTGILPAGALRLASALGFCLLLIPVVAVGGRLFGSANSQERIAKGVLEGFGDLVGNALGALLVAVPTGIVLRVAFANGGLEAALATLAEARGDLSFEGLLLRATICGALLAWGLENWRTGERRFDRVCGFLLATVPMVLWGFSLVAVDLLVLPMTLVAEGMHGGQASALMLPSLFPVIWGNLMGATLVAALLSRREQLSAIAAG